MAYHIVEAKTYPNGMQGQIVVDPDPQPYGGDTLGQIAYLKRSRYTLGTEAVSSDRMDEIAEGIRDGTYIGLPVFAYVHGGATIRAGSGFTCAWDSGQSGFVYCDRAAALKEFGNEQGALECLRSEVKVCGAYLAGDVYGWRLLDADGDVLDDCWGYYGSDEFSYMWSCVNDAYDEEAAREAREQAAAVAKEAQEAAEALYWAQRDVMTEGA